MGQGQLETAGQGLWPHRGCAVAEVLRGLPCRKQTAERSLLSRILQWQNLANDQYSNAPKGKSKNDSVTDFWHGSSDVQNFTQCLPFPIRLWDYVLCVCQKWSVYVMWNMAVLLVWWVDCSRAHSRLSCQGLIWCGAQNPPENTTGAGLITPLRCACIISVLFFKFCVAGTWANPS